MRSLAFLLLSAFLLCTPAPAQEVMEQEKTREIARAATAELPKLETAAFSFDGDTEQAQLVVHEKAGALIIPAKGLTAAQLEAAGEKPVPVGQLWLRLGEVSDAGKILAQDKTRIFLAPGGEQKVKVAIYLLAAIKNKDGVRQLAVYGKDAEALVTVPLEAQKSAQGLPIEMSGRKINDDSGKLLLKILGEYRAELHLVRSEE